MDKKIIIEYTERWSSGGIESFILNLIKNLDKSKFKIEIVVAQKEADIYDEELAACGCVVQSILSDSIPNPIERMIKNKREFKKYFINHKCDILHLHICQGVAMVYAKIAKDIGINKVITHCHNSAVGDSSRIIKLLGHNLGKRIYRKYVDEKLACSDLAAKWLYTNYDMKNRKVQIIKNIVDVDNFKYSKEDRILLRKKYKIDESVHVYLNIGRMNYQKNQKFLLDIYKEICIIQKNCLLVMIGTGELREKLHLYARKLGIYEKILFIEITRNVNKYMSMADIFLLPSLFEGNPIVGIEAQASGLLCFFSNTITKQAKILSTSQFIDLNNSSKIWAKKIISNSKINTEIDRNKATVIMRSHGYDIINQMLYIERLYSDY